MFNVANAKGKTTVKKVKPVQGDCLYSETQATFISKKSVEIPIQSNERYHKNNRRYQNPLRIILWCKIHKTKQLVECAD